MIIFANGLDGDFMNLNLKKIGILLLLVFSLHLVESCGVAKTGRRGKTTVWAKNNVNNSISSRAKAVLEKAKSFLGTPYQYGGTTSSGMDCSGLLWNSFKEIKIELPRVSREQAKYGVNIRLENIQPGDALFFDTGGGNISHAGIVDHIKEGEIFFIHSSSSRGVIVSSLETKYWKKRFVKAVRFIH